MSIHRHPGYTCSCYIGRVHRTQTPQLQNQGDLALCGSSLLPWETNVSQQALRRREQLLLI